MYFVPDKQYETHFFKEKFNTSYTLLQCKIHVKKFFYKVTSMRLYGKQL